MLQTVLTIPTMNNALPATTASSSEKQWALAAHLSPLSGYFVPLGSVLGPLLVWLAKKDDSPLVADHARDALNFHISMLIWMAIAAFASLFIVGIPVLLALGIWDLVATIIGAVKASNGERWKYPLSIEFIK